MYAGVPAIRPVNVENVPADLLVVDFRFGEQNSPFVQFLLAVFGCLATGFARLPARFCGLFPLLRIEPNLLFAAFVS